MALEPPGHYVDSRIVRDNLTPALKRKIGRRTVIRRVNEKGYYDSKKMNKTDLGVKVMKTMETGSKAFCAVPFRFPYQNQ